MFTLYGKRAVESGFYFTFSQAISLFGCNAGFIPTLLKLNLTSDATEPHAWHFNVERTLCTLGYQDQAILIDLMPRAVPPSISLYELADVWGYSRNGWTPLMFHLKSLYIEEDPSPYTKQHFVRIDTEIGDPIFSMTYLPKSTIQNGSLIGKWLPPGPSSTNSVLLWPYAFKYFADQAAHIMKR